MKIRTLLLTLVMGFSVALLAGCDFDGGVEQGRCVAFDATGKTLTIVVDVALDRVNPNYSGGTHNYKLPVDPVDMGPVPVPGGLLMVDLAKSVLLLYDQGSKGVRELAVQFTDVEKNVGSDHPKVKGKAFPVIDKEKQTITIYSARLKALATFKAAAAELELPPYAWKMGDEMRIAFKNTDKAQAARIMNVTKTDIFKK